MTEKRYFILDSPHTMPFICDRLDNDKTIAEVHSDNVNQLCDLLNEQEETIQKQNQEITACHDTLTTIHELCYAVLNYDFKNVNDKIDFCHMLNEMDNKDLMFLKECFEAIRDNDLKTMTSLTVECNGDGVCLDMKQDLN